MGLRAMDAYFSQLRVQHRRIHKVLEGSFLGHFPRRVNHVEAHHGLTVSKRGFDVVDDRGIFENALRLPGQAEIGTDDLCLGIFLLETIFGSR